ncbi:MULTISPECIES: hypothetical protein [Vibrio harveyi group]|uniref:hypothetical protein n=1 Tax=Vibrio harveyi group TaxID=717610 RepID=UPI00042051A8|nr:MULTISPECIES: hypothetical protein [Vibrio harveyi group]MDF4430505.1 hypothetical protein [Vibrio parahaemolyticus]MDF4448984.1 hypothetical protein [Vibrio parahaemolyticus]MDF4816238.1 hypothetical protein [Vibrio parahaemolyticus]MDF4936666.1 hypothetical protein [Vibrio parahaemolyticus]MDF5064077.1 hypothetical protein [Vibrio parahaemolyticus]
MQYRRTEKFIYKRDEICSIFKSDDIEQIIAKHDYIVSIDFERFVYLRSTLPPDFFDKLALSLREDELCYISFEDALSRWSVISQIPMILILGTTGESGFYKTRFGSIEFVHVPHSRELILSNTTEPYYAIRLAKKFFAFEDLKRIDRNMHLIDYEELYCDD